MPAGQEDDLVQEGKAREVRSLFDEGWFGDKAERLRRQ